MSITNQDAKAYVNHLAQARPRLIQSQEEADAVQDLIMELALKVERTVEDRQFQAFLGRLVLVWEKGRYQPIRTDPIDLIKSLLEENNLAQQTLVGSVFPSKGIASEVLSGKRDLTYKFVERLAAYFHVSPGLFYPVSPMRTTAGQRGRANATSRERVHVHKEVGYKQNLKEHAQRRRKAWIHATTGKKNCPTTSK